MKGRAKPWLAFNPHCPPHQFGQPLTDRQPEARSSIAPGCRGIHLAERLKQARLPFFRNADARIPDSENKLVDSQSIVRRSVQSSFFILVLDRNREYDFTLFRKLDSIGE